MMKLLFILFSLFSKIALSDNSFEKAFKFALIESNEIKKTEYVVESKKKLLLSSYYNKDWNAHFTSSLTFENKELSNSGKFNDQNLNLNTITLSKNILDFGQTKNLVAISKNNIKIARNDLKAAKQILFINTLVSYLNLYNSNKIIKLRKSNVKRFKRAVEASKLKLIAGAITPTTVSEAEARLARSEYEFALSKSEKINVENNFKSLVGENFNIQNLTFPVFIHKLPNDIDKAIEFAIKTNVSLINTKLKRENAFLIKKKQIYSNNPSLDINFHIKDSEDYSNSSSNDYTSYGSTITFKTSLFKNKYEKNLILSLDNEFKALVMDEKETFRKVKLKTLSIFNNYINSDINVKAAIKEFNAAKLALNGIKKEEQFGLRTLLDVLDSEADVINSELKVLKSRTEQVINKYKLLIDIGNLKL